MDDATDDYRLEPITTDNVNQRDYYGVTHLLRSEQDQSHAIQVICLQQLRQMARA